MIEQLPHGGLLPSREKNAQPLQGCPGTGETLEYRSEVRKDSDEGSAQDSAARAIRECSASAADSCSARRKTVRRVSRATKRDSPSSAESSDGRLASRFKGRKRLPPGGLEPIRRDAYKGLNLSPLPVRRAG